MQQLIATKETRDSLLDAGLPLTPDLLQQAINLDPKMTQVEIQRARGSIQKGDDDDDDAPPPNDHMNCSPRKRSVKRGNMKTETDCRDLEDISDSDDESYTPSNNESSTDESLQADDDISFRID